MKLKWEFCLFFCFILFFYSIESRFVIVPAFLFLSLYTVHCTSIRSRKIQRSQLTWGSIRTEYFFISTSVLWSQHDLAFQPDFGSGTITSYVCGLHVYVIVTVYVWWSHTMIIDHTHLAIVIIGGMNAKRKMKTHTTKQRKPMITWSKRITLVYHLQWAHCGSILCL